MIANKRLTKVSLLRAIAFCFLVFGGIGLILKMLGVITTEIGPKIISIAISIGFILSMFVGNYLTRAKNEKDLSRYYILTTLLAISCVVPAQNIAELLGLSGGSQIAAAVVIAALLFQLNSKIEKMRSKKNVK